MATLNSVIVPAKVLKGGKHKIRISVSHNSEFRYIVTDIVIDSAKEFKNGQIVKRPDASILNTKLRGIMQKYQTAIDNLEYTEGLTCAELVCQIKHADKFNKRTLKSIYDEYFEYSHAAQATKKGYVSSYRCITKIISEFTLLENINHVTILALDKHLREDLHLKPGTVRNRLTFLFSLLNYAQRCGYVQYKVSPSRGYELPKADVRDSWLSVDEIRRIRDCKPATDGQRLSRDMFMLSYYLGGINMADLVKINFAENTDRIQYVRQKTERRAKRNKYIEFEIPNEAKEIIQRHIGADGRLALSDRQRCNALGPLLYANIHKLARTLKIPNLVYYSARKSFSQHAYELGIDTSTIDYILGHKIDRGGSSICSYVTVTPDLATKAIKKVLANLK